MDAAAAAAKRRAAEAALPLLADGMVVGLGTGSTADYFLVALGEAVRDGRLRDVVGVPSSEQSARRAGGLGIALATLAERPTLDLTVDGADEFDPQLRLIKGLGGALVREKIVAQASRRFVIIADEGKRVARLGTRSPLPVEVVTFAHESQPRFFRSAVGAEPTLRAATDGRPFVTDNGNFIYDLRFAGGIADPLAVERTLLDRAGVVGTGLFLDMAETVLVGSADGVQALERPTP